MVSIPPTGSSSVNFSENPGGVPFTAQTVKQYFDELTTAFINLKDGDPEKDIIRDFLNTPISKGLKETVGQLYFSGLCGNQYALEQLAGIMNKGKIPIVPVPLGPFGPPPAPLGPVNPPGSEAFTPQSVKRYFDELTTTYLSLKDGDPEKNIIRDFLNIPISEGSKETIGQLYFSGLCGNQYALEQLAGIMDSGKISVLIPPSSIPWSPVEPVGHSFTPASVQSYFEAIMGVLESGVRLPPDQLKAYEKFLDTSVPGIKPPITLKELYEMGNFKGLAQVLNDNPQIMLPIIH